MIDMQNDDNIPYALDANGNLVSITYIAKLDLHGLACNCCCPKCKEPLEARIGSGKRVPYFAHSKHSNCHGAIMTIRHILARNLIEKHKAVMAPAYYTIPSRQLKFVDVEVEKREDRKDMQPDIVGITDDGKRWAIEIRNTHEVGLEKISKIIESGIACIEIDVRSVELEKMEAFILHSPYDREWISNPYDDELLPKQENSTSILSKSGLNTSRYVETPVPDYFYSSSKVIVKRNVDIKLKIPNSCHSLHDYYLYLKSKTSFIYDGLRQQIIKIAFSSACEQLLIIHTGSYGASYTCITLIFLDSDGNVFEETRVCVDINKMSDILDAIKKDWRLKAKELKENEGLPFPKQNDNIMPF